MRLSIKTIAVGLGLTLSVCVVVGAIYIHQWSKGFAGAMEAQVSHGSAPHITKVVTNLPDFDMAFYDSKSTLQLRSPLSPDGVYLVPLGKGSLKNWKLVSATEAQLTELQSWSEVFGFTFPKGDIQHSALWLDSPDVRIDAFVSAHTAPFLIVRDL